MRFAQHLPYIFAPGHGTVPVRFEDEFRACIREGFDIEKTVRLRHEAWHGQ